MGYLHEVSDGGEWAGESKSVKTIQLKDRVMRKDVVPDVKGMTAKDAVYILESMGYIVEMSGFGRVVSQSVRQGELIEKGRLIQIVLEEK
jgi:cell division protein FtsI (penicillin-binding protein 3)